MLTLTCELRFPDGAAVTGVIKASSYEKDYTPVLSGAVDRLPEDLRTEKMQAMWLEFRFKTVANETGAEFTVTHRGHYDRWAL